MRNLQNFNTVKLLVEKNSPNDEKNSGNSMNAVSSRVRRYFCSILVNYVIQY